MSLKRTGIARGTKALRRTAIAPGATTLARRPLNSESPKRRAERPIRQEVRLNVIQRDQGCAFHQMLAAATGVPAGCSGRVEVHEVTKRSRRPGSHLDEECCVALCSEANAWVENWPDAAEVLGLSIPGWPALDVDRALDEAWRIRARWVRVPGLAWAVPTWRDGEDLFAASARRGLIGAGWPAW